MTLACVAIAGCGDGVDRQPAPQSARNLVLITIDTLRADRVGAYGYTAARTPSIDALAARGTRFSRAYAAAPITLTSHASLLSGRYPAGHGARHNGLRIAADVPLITETFAKAGFATAAFVGAFPLDRRFGLDRGFQTYGDRMPRIGGKQTNERPGQAVVDDALEWLRARAPAASPPGTRQPFFLWVHLFEPHAPYGTPTDQRPASARYDDEVAEADRQAGRIIEALAPERGSTVFVVTADHGEAFGEHGEIAHSIFVYDTTLRVPLVMAGPDIRTQTVETPVTLVDIAPTMTRLMGAGAFDADGIDLGDALRGSPPGSRTLYAESFAPLLDFGWSPLRAVRTAEWKFIDAPRPELYRGTDAVETANLAAAEPARVAELRQSVQRYSPPSLPSKQAVERDAAARLQTLGYVGTATRDTGRQRADPKDRRDLAADIARVTSGELRGAPLETALRRIIAVDRGNPQAHMRLGFVLQESGRCAEGIRHFTAAIEAGMPGADPHLGLAGCHAAAGRFDAAASALRNAERAERDNPVVAANLGIVLSDGGRPADGIAPLRRAIELDPDFHEARFNLARALARTGRRSEAAREAEELLRRLPPGTPQRAEVTRLLAALR